MAMKPSLSSRVQSKATGVLPDHEQIATLAKALAHPARVKVVETLLRRRTCIGCDIVEEIGLAASTTSDHLRILNEAGLLIGKINPPRACPSLKPVAVDPPRPFLQLVEYAEPPALPRQAPWQPSSHT